MTYYDPNFENRRQTVLGGKVSKPTASSNNGVSSSSYVDSDFQQRRTRILSTPSKKVATSSTVKIAQPKTSKVQTKPNLLQQAGNEIGKIAGNAVNEVKNKIIPEKKLISPVASKVYEKKLPSSGLKLTLVDSKQNQTANLKTNKSTLVKQKKEVAKIQQTSDNVQKFFDAIGKPLDNAMKTLSKGVVPNKNQLQPRVEYKSDAEYKKAFDRKKQEDQGKYDVSSQVNRIIGQAIVRTNETSSLGLLQGNVQTKNKTEEIASQIATYAPLVGVPVLTLAKFFAVSTAFDFAFNKVTGKQRVSELLSSDTPAYIKTGVDLLEFLGKALVSHGIKTGKIRDTFIRKTVEEKGIPSSYYMSAKDVQDVVIGKNTGYQKDLLSKLNMTSSEWRKAVKTGAQIETPTSTIVTVTDRPYWSKLKGLFGIAPTDPKITVISPKTKVTNISGLIEPGEYTPEQLQNKIINGPLRNTEDGKALMKESFQAQREGKNVQVGDLPKVIADELNSKNVETARKQIRIKEDNAYKSPLEKKSTQDLYKDPIKYRDTYLSKYKNLVNQDLARTLHPDYKGVNSVDLDNYAVGLKNVAYEHLLETGKQRSDSNNTVLWTGGGPGSTKSTKIDNIPQAEKDKYIAIVDSTFSADSSPETVKKALSKGYKAETLFTLADPFESWKRVINRALDKNSVDYNRVVSEEYFIKAHEKARDQAVKTYNKFKDNPNYIGRFYKKLGSDPASVTNIDFVKNFTYNADTLRRQINEYTDKLKSEGKISEELYKGFTSDRVGQNVVESRQESKSTSNSSKQTSEVKPQERKYIEKATKEQSIQILKEELKNYSLDELIDSQQGGTTVGGGLYNIGGYTNGKKVEKGKIGISFRDGTSYTFPIKDIVKVGKKPTTLPSSKEKTPSQPQNIKKEKRVVEEGSGGNNAVKVLEGIENDIPYETARNAHYWNSMNPERAGKYDLESYKSSLTSDYEKLSKLVKTPEDQTTLDTMFGQLREGFKKRFLSSLNAKSKTASSMVTGPANFPVARNRAKLENERKITENLYAYEEYMVKKITNTINPQTIKSSDSNAVEQLEKKLANLEERKTLMIEANKIIRSKTNVEQRLGELGLTEESIKKLLTPYFGRVGFQPFELTSTNLKIKTASKRIEQLKVVKESNGSEVAFDGGKIVINPEAFRVQVLFNSRPDSEMISKLKHNGFRWSPRNTAWQRQLTDNSIKVTEKLFNVSLKEPAISTSDNNAVKTGAQETYTLKLENETLEITKQDIIDKINMKPSEALTNYNGGGLVMKISSLDYYKIASEIREQKGYGNKNKFPIGKSEGYTPELQKKFNSIIVEAQTLVKEGKFELKKTNKGFDAIIENGVVAEFQKLESDKVKPKPLIGKTELKSLLSNSNEFSKNPVLIVRKDGKNEVSLNFKGDKFKFKVEPGAMGLNYDNLLQLEDGTEIRVDKESLSGLKSQMRVYKNGQVFASVGDYADIKNRTNEIQNAPIVEFPELVKIAKELMDRPVDIGVPRFRPTLGGRPNGLFTSVGNGKIILNPSIFKTPGQAAKTLAHELGHLADYLPEKTMKRGNLLGRIASLNKYMKTLLKESPDSEFELITPKERAKIRYMAQKEGKNNYETVTREIEVGKEPTNPEEILSIWRNNTASIDNPELNSYIAGLSDERKKEIVVAAMRNKIPDWVTFMHTVKETVTEKVLKNSPQDIKALYKKMLKEEILKRRLFDLETIKKELSMLSQKWRPFNANLSQEGLVSYRQNPKELYADAISVLFNDPAMLKEDAPTFWKAFFNYADQKPEVHSAILNTWDLLNKGEEAVFESRQKDVEKMFDNSEQVFTAKNLEKVKEKTNLVYTLKLLFNNTNEPIIRKVNQAKKEGKTVLDEKNPIYPYEGMSYMDGKLENFVQENFQPIFAKSQEMSSDGWQKLGSVLLYERSMNERGELANPLGFDPKTAGDQLRGLEKSMNPKDWQTLQDSLKLFRKANEKILNLATESEFYSPELLSQMKANKSYATYQVIDYLDTYVSAHVSKSIGTLKDIANPATSTIMKGISVVKAIERNNAKKTAVAFFKENFPDEITPAKSVYMGKGRRQFVESQDPDMKMIKLIENGQMTAYYVEKDLADTINSQQNNTIIKTAKIARVLTGAGVYRPLFTSLNLGFSTFNFVRDFQRYWVNVPDYTLLDAMTSFPRAIYRYGQAIPSATRRARGKNDTTIQEMKDLNILGATYRGVFEHNEVNPDDQQIERIMKNYGLLDEGKKRTILTPFVKVLDSIDGFNNFIETLPKVAGYNELKGKGRMNTKQLADFIRNDVGSPNFRTRGQLTPISNSILLFSNAIKEGIKSDVQVATGRKGKYSAGGFWWKTIASTLLPTMLMFAGSIGLLGKWYEDRMKDVSEYDKTNFTIIPVGQDSDGKTTYLRVPRAETQRFIGGLLWKVMRNSSRKDLKLEDIFDVFDYGAGQLPGVTPLWTGVGATISYLSGKNPYDAFRNRNVIPDTEFKAGFKYSLPKFVDWLSKNQGAGIMLPSYVPTDPTKLQQALAYPFVSNVIGRWLKSSDYGQTEANNRLNSNIDREKAQQSIEGKDKLDKALKEYKSGDQTKDRRVKIVKQLIKDVVGPIQNSDDKRKRTNLIKKFEIALIKGQSNPLTNSIIDANTNDAKVQILLNAKETLGDGFKDYVNTLYRNKVISVNVIKILKSKK